MKTEQELRNHAQFLAVINYEAVAASTGYVLVDLSDTTNYPHSHTGMIFLHQIHFHAEVASSGVYDVWFGVVIENDATDGSVDWIHVAHLQSLASLLGFEDEVTFHANLEVVDGAMTQVLSAAKQADNGTWANATGLGSPAGAAAGATGKPGVGDLVMWVEEVSGSGTIDFSVAVSYETL